MINQLPPELFAQRPVRSEYANARDGLPITRRLVLFVGGVAAILIFIGVLLSSFVGSHNEETSQEVGEVTAELPLKERPEQPGGIDIPHQDVTVFQQLDENGVAQKPAPEQLLPQPDEPAAQADATVSPTGEENLPPAVTEAATDAQNAVNEAKDVLQATGSKVESAVTDQAQAVTETMTQKVDQAATAVPKAAENVVKDVTPPSAPISAPVEDVASKVEAKPEIKAEPVAPKATSKTTAKTIEKAKSETVNRLPQELFTTGEVSAEPKPARTTAPVAAPTGRMVRVQLASFKDQVQAQKEAAKLQAQHSASLHGAALSAVRADLGAKGIYYRVMSDKIDESVAKSICNELKSSKVGCLIAR
ncbi:MAG: SPOR domain-containing protein [Proteobacteria bacterium]|jgi:hypothetical protein|nr:SPOR domain-containing protein [Alphaproteobacteria bacterium]NCC02703.1 SPOR domain-containing protein [Pseudomonadota bacterium]